MDVVHRLHPEIRQRQLFALRQRRKHVRIEVASRVERRPTSSDDRSGMAYGGGESVAACFVEQICLDSSLLRAVVAERPALLALGSRHLDTRPMYPDRPAAQEMLHAATQHLDQ